MSLFRPRRGHPADEGFTLVEVVVAMILLSLVMTGLVTFFVRGIASSAGLERRTDAVALANRMIETARAVPPTKDDTGISKLVDGRSAAAVSAQWTYLTGLSSVAGLLSTTAQAADTAYAAGETPVLPLNQTVTVAGTPYAVDILVGTCKQPAANVPCSSTTPLPGAEMLRIVVRVAWGPGGNRGCNSASCQYTLTTLVDANRDQTFNSSYDALAPVAADDTLSVTFGTAKAINVLSNDTGVFNSTPVTITTNPANGTLSGATNTGSFTYTPKPNWSGTETFQYRLADSSGQISNIATVSVTVGQPAPPVANNFTLTVAPGGTVSANLLSDNGNSGTFPASNAATRVGTWPAGAISATGVFSWTAPAGTAVGTAGTVTYRLTDVVGRAVQATITVTVVRPAAPVVRNFTTCMTGASMAIDLSQGLQSGTAVSGGWTAFNRPSGGNSSGYWSVTAASAAGSVTVSRGTTTRTDFEYSAKDSFGQTSNTATVTVNRTC